MNFSEDSHKIHVQVTFDTIYQELNSIENSTVIMSHFGKFSQDLVNSISEGVEGVLVSLEVKKSIIKRIFSILIEGLQNLRIHGGTDPDDNQVGHVIVLKIDKGFKISFGSYATNDDRLFLEEHLNKLNAMTDLEAKSFYMEILGNGVISDKGGAGLGFITIRNKAKSILNYRFIPTDYKDLYYFEFGSEVIEDTEK